MRGTISVNDAALRLFPDILQAEGARYLIAALVMSGVLWILRRTSLRARVLQNRRPTRADYVREVSTSARSVLIYALVATPAVWLSLNGYTSGRFDGGAGALTISLHVLALLLMHDTWFYWTHRAMHDRRLFAKWHRTHHRSTTPTPFTAYAFDWREAIVQALFVSLWIAFIPTPLFAMLLFLGIMIARNVWGHCGTEFHPRGMADHPFWGVLTTTTHHDLHHGGGFNHNYGLYFTWWDRVMGTEHPRYRKIYREVTSRPLKPRRQI